jgi:hypothetical protein
VIGGRVLDTTALQAAARGSSLYAQAFITAARSTGIVLAIPAVAWQRTWRDSDLEDRPFLQLLREISVVVFDDLTPDAAQASSLLGSEHALDVLHVAWSALTRDWDILTSRPETFAGIHPDIGVEPID